MHFLQSEVGIDPIVVEGLFRAPLARVYRAWTDPEQLVKWFGLRAGAMVSASVDLQVGGQWRFVMHEDDESRASLQGTYSVVETEKRLCFTWSHLREHADGRREETPHSTVTVTFRAEGAATHVHLRHEGIRAADGRKGVGGGWEASFRSLADLLANTPVPATSRTS
ncbi:MAG: SRPBCC family protein [Kiloniellales bacterium]